MSSVFVWCIENNTDTTGYKKRSTLSTIENKQLEDMKRDPVLQTFRGLSFLFEDPVNQLEEWPSYFKNKEASGHAIQRDFLNVWSTFIIAVSSSSKIRRVLQLHVMIRLSQKILTGRKAKV